MDKIFIHIKNLWIKTTFVVLLTFPGFIYCPATDTGQICRNWYLL